MPESGTFTPLTQKEKSWVEEVTALSKKTTFIRHTYDGFSLAL
jgi:hypothetical protein